MVVFARLIAVGTVYELTALETTIGRNEGNDIILKGSKSISGRHARISIHPKTKDKAKLLDLNSLNGCFVNNIKVIGGSQDIVSGDVIRFGYDPTEFRFQLGSDAELLRPPAPKKGPTIASAPPSDRTPATTPTIDSPFVNKPSLSSRKKVTDVSSPPAGKPSTGTAMFQRRQSSSPSRERQLASDGVSASLNHSGNSGMIAGIGTGSPSLKGTKSDGLTLSPRISPFDTSPPVTNPITTPVKKVESLPVIPSASVNGGDKSSNTNTNTKPRPKSAVQTTQSPLPTAVAGPSVKDHPWRRDAPLPVACWSDDEGDGNNNEGHEHSKPMITGEEKTVETSGIVMVSNTPQQVRLKSGQGSSQGNSTATNQPVVVMSDDVVIMQPTEVTDGDGVTSNVESLTLPPIPTVTVPPQVDAVKRLESQVKSLESKLTRATSEATTLRENVITQEQQNRTLRQQAAARALSCWSAGRSQLSLLSALHRWKRVVGATLTKELRQKATAAVRESKSVSNTVTGLEGTVQTLTAERDAAVEGLNRVTAEATELSKDKTVLEHTAQTTQQKLSAALQQVQLLTSQLADASGALRDSESKQSMLQQQLEAAVRSSNRLSEQQTTLMERRSQEQVALKQLSQQCGVRLFSSWLQRRVGNSVGDAFTRWRLATLKHRVREAQERNRSEAQRLSQSVDVSSSLKDDKYRLELEVSRLMAEVKQWQEREAAANSNVTALKEELLSVKGDLSRQQGMQSQCEALSRDVSKLKDELSASQAHCQSLCNQLRDCCVQLRAVETERDGLNEMVSRAAKVNAKSEDKLASLHGALMDCKRDHAEVTRTAAVRALVAWSTTRQRGSIAKSFSRWKHMTAVMSSRMWRSKHSEALVSVDKQRTSNNTLQRDMEAIISERDALKGDVVRLREELETVRSSLAALTEKATGESKDGVDGTKRVDVVNREEVSALEAQKAFLSQQLLEASQRLRQAEDGAEVIRKLLASTEAGLSRETTKSSTLLRELQKLRSNTQTSSQQAACKAMLQWAMHQDRKILCGAFWRWKCATVQTPTVVPTTTPLVAPRDQPHSPSSTQDILRAVATQPEIMRKLVDAAVVKAEDSITRPLLVKIRSLEEELAQKSVEVERLLAAIAVVASQGGDAKREAAAKLLVVEIRRLQAKLDG